MNSKTRSDLASQIRRKYRPRANAQAIATGKLLIKARKQFAHGEWQTFLRVHCGMPTSTAFHYVRLAKRARR